MFYLYYNETGRIFEYQHNSVPDERPHLAVETIPDNVFNKAVVNGVVTDYIKTDAEIAAEIEQASNEAAIKNRRKRNSKLRNSDWTQMPDSPLSDADKTAWQTYRQALRDLPGHANWPDLQASDFPNKPD